MKIQMFGRRGHRGPLCIQYSQEAHCCCRDYCDYSLEDEREMDSSEQREPACSVCGNGCDCRSECNRGECDKDQEHFDHTIDNKCIIKNCVCFPCNKNEVEKGIFPQCIFCSTGVRSVSPPSC